MISTYRQNLLESIATTIADYRHGEIYAMTPDHVNRWVDQFNRDEQLTILAEMDRILKIYYVSRQKAKDIIRRALTSHKIFGTHPARVIARTGFLRIQRKGSSQDELLTLADEVTQAEYGISITSCGESPVAYIYLDDCLFSGNTVRYDLKQWLPEAIRGTTVYLIFLAAHNRGLSYLQQRLDAEAKIYDVSLDYRKWYKFNNLPQDTERFECLWPCEISGDELVDTYIQQVRDRCQGKNFSPRLFRPSGVPTKETIFSSPEAREVVEGAFLKAGAYIVSLAKSPKPEMRPLGYEYLESLGFGAIFVTYRNIANNCPLVLWWGDPSFPSSHPVSKWYPLFPRKVNQP
jgi:hypothetical protein